VGIYVHKCRTAKIPLIFRNLSYRIYLLKVFSIAALKERGGTKFRDNFVISPKDEIKNSPNLSKISYLLLFAVAYGSFGILFLPL
jgi:hypothetical protein